MATFGKTIYSLVAEKSSELSFLNSPAGSYEIAFMGLALK